jgi:hypothetical protein
MVNHLTTIKIAHPTLASKNINSVNPSSPEENLIRSPLQKRNKHKNKPIFLINPQLSYRRGKEKNQGNETVADWRPNRGATKGRVAIRIEDCGLLSCDTMSFCK